MVEAAEQHRPLAPSEVSAALEWNRVEENRRLRRRQVARIKAKQRVVDINEWAGRNSSSAKLQATVKKALRDWFEAARNGSGGVPCVVLVDAVITLGLNQDLKQVKRTISGAADTSSGQLRTLKTFTAALLACCACDLSKERLFRSLRGEDAWRRSGVDGTTNAIHPKATALTSGSSSSGVPAFLTQLTAYRRKLLMATVADKFPTPCMSSIWTPDCEKSRQPETKLPETAEVCCTAEVRSSATVATRDPESPGSGCDRLAELQGGGKVTRTEHAKASLRARGLGDVDGHACLAISPVARPASVEARKRYQAVSEAFFGAEDGDQLQRLTAEEPPCSLEGDPQHQQAGRASTLPGGGDGRDGPHDGSSSGTIWMASTNERHPQQRDVDGEAIRDTAEHLRGSMLKKEESLAGTEARWEDYQVMKRRWRRRTPASILMDDRMDEPDRVYSRISRPTTREGTGASHPGSANSSRVCSASTCRRPSTAPAGTIADGSSWRPTTLGTSSVVTGGSTTSGRRCWQERALPLGPIPLDEGRKLRYPLLQLEREKIRAASAASRARGAARSAGRRNCSSHVDIPVTRNRKGRWDPHLVKVPCGPQF